MRNPAVPSGKGSTLAAAIMALAFSGFLPTGPPSAAIAAESRRPQFGMSLGGALPSGITPTVTGRGKAFQAPDLVVSAVSNPPANASPGSSFAVTDTTRNVASTPVPVTYTKYYLSSDLMTGNDIALNGQRPVAQGLVSSAPNMGTQNVTLPATVPPGSYYLLACADALAAVPEANEGNNCWFSGAKVAIGLPDLVLSLVSTGTPVVPPGGYLRLGDSTLNLSAFPTPSETYTEYYLSQDLAAGNDIAVGRRPVSEGLVAGDQITWNTAVTLPPTTAPGSYYLLACADAAKTVPETDEGNNCRFAAEKVTVGWSDLVVASVSNPPAIASPGDNMVVTDTTRNLLQVPTGTAPFTSYYLSSDLAAGNDIDLGRRKVAESLGAGADGTGSVTVVIPSTTPLGSYYLLACVDYPKPGWIREANEENNCLFSQARISVDRPDLVVSRLSTATASAPYGGKIRVTDTARNAGSVPANTQVMSTQQGSGPGGRTYNTQSPYVLTRYYLSADPAVGNDTHLGLRQVPPGLGPGASDTATLDVAIPPTMMPGSYYLLACTDANNVVAESNEGNNCTFAPQKVVVREPQPGDF